MRSSAGRSWSIVGAVAIAAAVLGACGPPSVHATRGTVLIVAAENEYGDVARQLGGKYVTVQSIESNPNTDPHSYEVTAGVAAEVSSARIVIQNGCGYDTFMNAIEGASSSTREVIVAQDVLGLPSDTKNPHLWYDPTTMPTVAAVIVADLARIQPAHAAYFDANLRRFVASRTTVTAAIDAFRTRTGTDVVAAATTEPVGDYLLAAMGIDVRTPWSLEADVMNGVDPTPQDVAAQQALFEQRSVRVFVYNEQVTDSLTTGFIANAAAARVPIVGVYETMPAPGFDYQRWMLAEVHAISRAVFEGSSTGRL